MRRYRHALITGGTTGIGAALAESLARRGAKVAVCGRRPEMLEAVRPRLGDGAVLIQADVADTGRAASVVDEARERLGGLDLVVANAGFGINRPAARLKVEDVTAVFQLNVLGACATLTRAIPHLVEAGGGHLVGVSSVAGRRGLPTSAAYSASKAALSIFLESLRVDLRSKGIVVTDVRPGFVDTPLTKKNKFPMPFLVPADRAGELICRALEREKAVYTFPWQMALVARLMQYVPNFLWDLAGGRATDRVGEKS